MLQSHIFKRGFLLPSAFCLLPPASCLLNAYPTDPTQPFGIPAIWSMAFWGGVWGILLAVVTLSLGKKLSYWLTVLLFGALAPTAVFLFVVLPLKGMPVAGGWEFTLIATGLMLNGVWGLGTALLLQLAVDKVSKAKN